MIKRLTCKTFSILHLNPLVIFGSYVIDHELLLRIGMVTYTKSWIFVEKLISC